MVLVFFIAATLANALIFRSRGSKQAQGRPELEAGYRSIAIGYATWGNLPWVVMGIGCVFGGVPSVFHYFRPRDGNPFVLAFFASVFLVWILGSNWIVFKGGAEALVKHPGLLNYELKSPRMVILLWFFSLAAGIVAAIVMFSTDLPLPTHRTP